MRSRRIILAIILVFPLLTAGCLRDVVRELAKDLTNTKNLQGDLTKRFGDEVFVSVEQAGGRLALNVTFVNSPLNAMTPADRASRAQETANVVQLRYPDVARLNAIWVVFVRERRTLVFIDERQSVDYYGFDNKGMRMSSSYVPGTVIGTDTRAQTSTNYLKDDNETDISVNGIQLSGTPGGNGLTVLPHFRARGDIRTAKSPPPKVVTFDFASYSSVEEFEPSVPVVLIADGRTLFKTTGNFKVSRTSGGVTELMSLAVPYPAFRSIVASIQLTIKLGSKEFSVKPQQLMAMRDMCDYLTE